MNWAIPAILASFLLSRLAAQEIDTVILKDTQRKYTVLDQIENPRERSDFLELHNARDPAQRHAAAEKFIAAWPQSWLLAEAYEAAAKSSVDLGEDDRALREGRFSLRLMPENAT